MIFRALGQHEIFAKELGNVSPHQIVITAHTDTLLQCELLTKAFEEVKRRHPLLNVSFSDSASNFVCLNNVLPTCQQFPDSLTEEEFIERELKRPFGQRENSSLIRLSYQKNKEQNNTFLCVTYHHVLGDAFAGLNFLLDVLKIYDLFLDRQKPFDLHNHYYDYTKPLDIKWKKPNIQIKGNKNSFSKNYGTTGVKHLTFEGYLKEAALIENCRQHLCKVFSGIAAALLLALDEVYSKREINCAAPVNYRDLLPFGMNDYEFGYLHSAISFKTNLNKYKNFWKLAKGIQERLRKKLETPKELLSNVTYINQLISDGIRGEKLVDEIGIFSPSIFLSNVGIVDAPYGYNHAILQKLHFSANCQLFSRVEEALFITMITSERVVSINFHYPAHLTNKNKINDFVECFRQKAERYLFRPI